MRNLIIGLVAITALACEPAMTIGTYDVPLDDTANNTPPDDTAGDTDTEDDGTSYTSSTTDHGENGSDNDDDTRPACLDADGDGYGDGSDVIAVSELVDGYVYNCSDCNDDSSSVHPGGSDTTADGVDQDCSGADYSGTTTTTTYTWYRDADVDGYGTSGTTTTSTTNAAPSGYVSNAGDCNDSSAAVSPADTEVASNGVDDDCDGSVDENTTWYRDSDGDGYGNASSTTTSATQPSGYVSNSTDCDDADGNVNPGETEVTGNGKNDDCESTTSDTASSSTCASTDSLVTGSFTAPAGATIVTISGMAEGTGTLAGEFAWTTLADGTPAGMDITVSSNVVSFAYATCSADAAAWKLSVYYTMSGADHWDCEGTSGTADSWTGTWTAARDGVAETPTVSKTSSGCDTIW